MNTVLAGVMHVVLLGISFVVGFFPTLLSVFLWNLLVPVTFWQKLAFIGVAAVVGGPIQIWLFLIVGSFLFTVYAN